MKSISQILISFLMSFYSSAQSCDELMKRFYVKNEFPNISDSSAFCEGVVEAKSYTDYALRFVGSPGHLTSCEIYSYERYGVRLEMTGDIIYDESIFDFNHGFNEVMYQRIEQSNPQILDSLGKLPFGMLQFDLRFQNEYLGLFYFNELTDSTVQVTLDVEKVKTSIFESLEGIVITDGITKQDYSLEELKNGVIFKLSKSQRGNFRLNFTSYIYPNRICTSEAVSIPFNVDGD
ncbi:MAG: hypothetical protein RLZ33_1247 [Bacteroidota bacterium]|jgi:hypothetical protein